METTLQKYLRQTQQRQNAPLDSDCCTGSSPTAAPNQTATEAVIEPAPKPVQENPKPSKNEHVATYKKNK